MIHGHGGNINEVARQLNCSPSDIFDMSSNICSNIKELSDKFICISLKTQENNHLLANRLRALSQKPDIETGPLNGLRVAC